jgi:hypothetical protein
LANGSLLQFVLDIPGFTQSFPTAGIPMAIASGGIGEGILGATGNIQVTLGNNATISMGRAFDVHVGPDTYQVHVNDGVMSPTIAGILGMLAIIFQEAYALLGAFSTAQVNEDARGVLVMVFQAACQVAVWALISAAVSAKITDLTNQIAQNVAHQTNLDQNPTMQAAIADLQNLQRGGIPVEMMVEGIVMAALIDSMSEADLATTDNLAS